MTIIQQTTGSLWYYYRDEPDATSTGSESFKFYVNIIGKTLDNDNTKDVKIGVSLKYFSNFWRTLEMPFFNCEINLILTRTSTRVIANSTSARKFAITDKKLYVSVKTLSSHDNAKLLEQLKSGFKRTINWIDI